MTATFSENVTVTGSPRLTIVLGDSPSFINRTATYNSGASGSNTLVFQYAIQNLSTDPRDSNGISIGANALALNSGTIKDLAGNDATITHSSVADNLNFKIK